MPTTFNVIPLGVQAIIDPTEGNTTAENANALVGQTFGDLFNPLWEQIQSLSPGSSSFTGGGNNFYDQNNAISNDTFSIDGGPDQTFDAASLYNTTITYTDGSTATISGVIFQDTAGNTYLAPEFSANADQAALEAGPIRSITLNSLLGSTAGGLTGSRESFDFVVCFAEGTRIRTPQGDRAVQSLSVGDLVCTYDHGPQPIRWIRGREVAAAGAFMPIRVNAGALGPQTPSRDLLLSRQHRLLVQSRIAARMFGTPQILVAANKLLSLKGVSEARGKRRISYWHFLCDRHEIVFANDTPAETLFLGQEARQALGAEALAEVTALFPDLPFDEAPTSARVIPSTRHQQRLVDRARRNRIPMLDGWIPA